MLDLLRSRDWDRMVDICDARPDHTLGDDRTYRASRGSRLGWLKQLDKISGRILQENLRAAGPRDDLVTELHAGNTQARLLGMKVLNDEVNAIPTAWLWLLPV